LIELVFMAVLQAAAGEPAQPAQQQPAAAQEQPVAEETAAEERRRRRCRVDTVTGSRLAARVRNSQAERESLSQEGRDMLQDSMRMWDNQSGTVGGN
jgi:hypothetical protein